MNTDLELHVEIPTQLYEELLRCAESEKISQQEFLIRAINNLILKEWKVEKFSEEMTMASEEAKLEGGRFWLQLMGYT